VTRYFLYVTLNIRQWSRLAIGSPTPLSQVTALCMQMACADPIHHLIASRHPPPTLVVSTVPRLPCVVGDIISDSTELRMADENAIPRAMQTLTFKKWSVLANNSELICRGLHSNKGEDDAIAEKKLIAQICLAAENSRKQALQKKQSQENKKKKLKETRCSLDDAPEMVAAESGRTYNTWLLLKEGDELEYNNKKFVKNMNNEGAPEKLLLSKIMRNHKESKDQRLRASSLRRNQAADRATFSQLGALVSEADLKIPGNWIWPKQ
jgi:hypothetical protein